MFLSIRPALFAAVGISTMFAFAGSDAAETVVEPSALTLPADVVEAARVETELTIVTDPAEIDAIPRDAKPRDISPAGSLSKLVARHAATTAASREDECLAIAVFFESKSEPLDGQLAVAKTVLNRARSGRFPNSVCGVVAQPGQFSFVRGGRLPAVASGRRDWQTAVAIAHIARADLWQGAVSNALFFHAKRVSPGWKLKRLASVGNHVFYR